VSVHAQSAFRTIQWWWSYINYSKNKNFVYPPNSYLNYYYYYILNTIITWSSKQKYWYCISHPTGSSTPPPLLTHLISLHQRCLKTHNHFSLSDISHFHVRIIIIIIINHCSFLNCQVLHYPPKTKMIFVCISPSLRAFASGVSSLTMTLSCQCMSRCVVFGISDLIIVLFDDI